MGNSNILHFYNDIHGHFRCSSDGKFVIVGFIILRFYCSSHVLRNFVAARHTKSCIPGFLIIMKLAEVDYCDLECIGAMAGY